MSSFCQEKKSKMSENVKDSFIYRWTNNSNGMLYIGVHKGTPDDGYICSSKPMKKDYKENPEHFTREILEYGHYKDMWAKEYQLLVELNAVKNPMYYNKGNGGKQFYNMGPLSPETRKKIGLGQLGRKLSEEHKQKIRLAKVGYKPTREAVEKTRLANLGRKASEETKKQMSLYRLGKKRKEETKRKISLTRLAKGCNHTPESKEKLRLANLGRKASEETKKKMSLTRLAKGFKHTPETRQKMSLAKTGQKYKPRLKKTG